VDMPKIRVPSWTFSSTLFWLMGMVALAFVLYCRSFKEQGVASGALLGWGTGTASAYMLEWLAKSVEVVAYSCLIEIIHCCNLPLFYYTLFH